MKTDISTRTDIERLVDAFYEKIKTDQTIGYLFNEVAKVDWQKHLPVMYDFWENILFSAGNYNGNPMVKHKELHARSTMNTTHFAKWLYLFSATVDEIFIGEKAEEIKERARNIAAAMMYKTLNS